MKNILRAFMWLASGKVDGEYWPQLNQPKNKGNKVPYSKDPNVFTDPGLTNGQGNAIGIRHVNTAWGGNIIYACEDAVFSGDAYKRFLAWMVTR